MQKQQQLNIFAYNDVGVAPNNRAYTTYKGLPIYNLEYLLDALKDAAGAELANMTHAYFADMQQQANEQLLVAQNATKAAQGELALLETAYNIAFSALKDTREQLSNMLYDDKRLSRIKLDKVEKAITAIYYTLKED